jgi:hypothetical protein
MEDEFKRQTYAHLEKHDKILAGISKDLYSHIEVAKVIESNDAKNYGKVEETLIKLKDSLEEADYVKSSELDSKLNSINETLKGTISLTNLIVVMGVCTAVVSGVITLMVYLRPTS